jgi:hypothetical protein
MPGISVQGAYLTKHGAKSFSQHLPEHKALCQRESHPYIYARQARIMQLYSMLGSRDRPAVSQFRINPSRISWNEYIHIVYMCIADLQICNEAICPSICLSREIPRPFQEQDAKPNEDGV